MHNDEVMQNLKAIGEHHFGTENRRHEVEQLTLIVKDDSYPRTARVYAWDKLERFALENYTLEDYELQNSPTTVFGLGHEPTRFLLNQIAAFIRRYVYLHDDQEAILAAWVLHTYAFRRFAFTPYIHITAAEKACGKSTLMDVLRVLVNNPRRSGGITAAALVRAVDRDQPTLFLDEMDAQIASNPEFAASVQGILNEGYRRGGVFTKCDGRNHELRDFNVYSPKCFAGIGDLMHDTTASRSVRIEMVRRTAGERVELFDAELAEELAQKIKQNIAIWATIVDNSGILGGIGSNERGTFRCGLRLSPIDGWDGRQNDTMRPLLTIGLLAGIEWFNRLFAALKLAARSNEGATESFGTMLLSDIRDYFDERNTDRTITSDLLEHLHQLDERPWPAWGFKREPMKPHQLAKELGKYRIAPRTLRTVSARAKGYIRGDFKESWERFCRRPKDEIEDKARTSEIAY